MRKKKATPCVALLIALALLATHGLALEEPDAVEGRTQDIPASQLPGSCFFHEALGFDAKEELIRGVIVYPGGGCAELSASELQEFSDLFWKRDMARYIQPLGIRVNGPPEFAYFNFYTKSGGFSVLTSCNIVAGSFGEDNLVWYCLFPSNSNNLRYRLLMQLWEKYWDENLPLGEEPFPVPQRDWLVLPESAWAVAEVQEAAASNILVYEAAGSYTKPITRNEFCLSLVRLLIETHEPGSRSLSGFTSDVLRSFRQDCVENRGIVELPFVEFKDMDPEGYPYWYDFQYDEHFSALGIISGREGGIFDPEGPLTRQEAAKILCQSARLFLPTDAPSSEFDDRELIADWARAPVDWVSANNILQGVGGNSFDPLGVFTREQAIASLNRLYGLVRPK